MSLFRLLPFWPLLFWTPVALASDPAEAPRVIRVVPLKAPPTLDGNLEEWNTLAEPGAWQSVEVFPALKDDTLNETGDKGVMMMGGVHGDTIYFAFRWPDDSESVAYKSWRWQRNKYIRGKERDDMLAIRFHMDGDYDVCMLSDKTYRVDVWKWSAGRSNLVGLAEDMTHMISKTPVEDAAEYGEGKDTIYIKKLKDNGEPFFDNTHPSATKGEEFLPGVEMKPVIPSSLTDVAAKGAWVENHWSLELSRKLNTGHDDDMIFQPGQKVAGAIAIFNKGYAEHKSVNGNLLFDLTAIR